MFFNRNVIKLSFLNIYHSLLTIFDKISLNTDYYFNLMMYFTHIVTIIFFFWKTTNYATTTWFMYDSKQRLNSQIFFK